MPHFIFVTSCSLMRLEQDSALLEKLRIQRLCRVLLGDVCPGSHTPLGLEQIYSTLNSSLQEDFQSAAHRDRRKMFPCCQPALHSLYSLLHHSLSDF